jgi:hypothetical protein
MVAMFLDVALGKEFHPAFVVMTFSTWLRPSVFWRLITPANHLLRSDLASACRPTRTGDVRSLEKV